jgi:hypothetical protein
VDNAGWDEMQFEQLRTNRYRVASVVAAVVAGDDFGLAGEPIDNTAFAFIAPLCAYDNFEWHNFSLQEVFVQGDYNCPLSQPLYELRVSMKVL